MAALDRQYIARFGDNANYALIPFSACAHRANLTLGEVLAYSATVDIFPGFKDGACKALTLPFGKRKNVKREALRTFSTYAGESCKFVYEVFE